MIERDEVETLIVKDMSRLGREYLQVGQLTERIFPLLDVRFIAVNDNFDTLTAERSQQDEESFWQEISA